MAYFRWLDWTNIPGFHNWVLMWNKNVAECSPLLTWVRSWAELIQLQDRPNGACIWLANTVADAPAKAVIKRVKFHSDHYISNLCISPGCNVLRVSSPPIAALWTFDFIGSRNVTLLVFFEAINTGVIELNGNPVVLCGFEADSLRTLKKQQIFSRNHRSWRTRFCPFTTKHLEIKFLGPH